MAKRRGPGNEGEAIMRTAIDLAKGGDATALKLCMERLMAPCGERTVELKLPTDVTTPAGVLGALRALVAALAGGEITPNETLAAARVLDGCRQAMETQELDRRLTALERSTAEDASTGSASWADGQHREPTAAHPGVISDNPLPEVRNVISGNPDPKRICTSHVERQNLTMRMQIRRMTRLTNGFSKKLDNHKAAVALHFAWYNFCQIRGSLRVTPAMEAGITNHVWTVQKLLKSNF